MLLVIDDFFDIDATFSRSCLRDNAHDVLWCNPRITGDPKNYTAVHYSPWMRNVF